MFGRVVIEGLVVFVIMFVLLWWLLYELIMDFLIVEVLIGLEVVGHFTNILF